MKIKYTKKGKKVEVIEKAGTQFLVKEIYIQENKEVSAGKCFLEEELFNEAPLTWEEKRRKETKDSHETHMNSLKILIQNEKKKFTHLKKKAERINNHLSNFIDADLMQITNNAKDLLTNKFKYAVARDGFVIKNNINDLIYKEDEYTREFKLVSLIGDPISNKDLLFKIHNYSDGSGYSTTYKFFKKKKDAVRYVIDNLNKSEKKFYNLDYYIKYNITLLAGEVKELTENAKDLIISSNKLKENNLYRYKREDKRYKDVIKDQKRRIKYLNNLWKQTK